MNAALSMWSGEVPCFFALTDTPCERTAEHVVSFEHEEVAPASCPGPWPHPVCDDHLRLLRQVMNAFWRTWYRLAPMGCPHCGVPMRLTRVEPIHS